MIATRPSLIYWRPATLSVIDRVRSLRERDGLRVLLTIDAGPSVVTLTHPDDTSRVQAALSAVPGVVRAIRTRIGGGARLVDGAPA
jgi:mevalonate pyrophosphate decarboxylase